MKKIVLISALALFLATYSFAVTGVRSEKAPTAQRDDNDKKEANDEDKKDEKKKDSTCEKKEESCAKKESAGCK